MEQDKGVRSLVNCAGVKIVPNSKMQLLLAHRLCILLLKGCRLPQIRRIKRAVQRSEIKKSDGRSEKEAM